MKTHLWSLIEARLAEHPDGTAFIQDGKRLSYADFSLLCRKTTSWLQTQGIGKDDKVAVWLVNRVEWLALFFALARVGATLVSVNTRYRSEEVTYLLNRSGARMLVMQPSFRKIDFAGILQGIDPSALPSLERIAIVDPTADTSDTLLGLPTVAFDMESAAPTDAQDSSDPDACTILFTTSGTTKGPKLVMHPQRTIVDHAWRCARAYGFDREGARFLAMLPFCGVFGLNGVLAAFIAGAPSVLMETFDGDSAAALMREHAITHTFGSDEMYQRLIPRPIPDGLFPSARFFGFGAFTSSITDFTREAWEHDIPLYGLYGSSEVLALFSAQPAHLPVEARIEGGGLPVAGNDAIVRIRDTATGELVSDGKSGEIEISAPSRFIGYYNNPEATAEAILPDGFFRTGDLGHLRGDGTFVYETRMGDAIRLGGFLVNPVEIEEVLKRFDGVADAQVVAVEIGGQMRVVAFIIPAGGASLTADALIAKMRDLVAPFKVPARIWFVKDYPMAMSSNGVKTQRNKLRDMARAYLAEDAVNR
jgi:fatty-acyl-CoA synthase